MYVGGIIFTEHNVVSDCKSCILRTSSHMDGPFWRSGRANRHFPCWWRCADESINPNIEPRPPRFALTQRTSTFSANREQAKFDKNINKYPAKVSMRFYFGNCVRKSLQLIPLNNSVFSPNYAAAVGSLCSLHFKILCTQDCYSWLNKFDQIINYFSLKHPILILISSAANSFLLLINFPQTYELHEIQMPCFRSQILIRSAILSNFCLQPPFAVAVG